MRRFLAALWIVVLFASQPCSAQLAQTGAGGVIASASYTGPGDVVSGATAWYGLRAYNNTLANAGATTTAVIDVLGATTATGCTIYLLGNGTGGLDSQPPVQGG